ncbi:MAG: DUF2058 domain-containing protein [Porticoccaceae bacterium]
MANPLQDQLLKAGLVKPHQIKKATKEKRQAQRGTTPEAVSEQARQAQQRKAESDRNRNREQVAERERKAQAAQIRQLIETQRLARSGGDSTFQFVDAGKIKKITLHKAQRAQIVGGVLAVVRFDSTYELVPSATAEKIAQRDPGSVVVFNVPSAQENPESDAYADYPVPDDLMW